MVSFEIFVKAMPPSLSELKVLHSFCFAFKIPDERAVTNTYKENTLRCCIVEISDCVSLGSFFNYVDQNVSIIEHIPTPDYHWGRNSFRDHLYIT